MSDCKTLCRCPWPRYDALLMDYHDRRWCRPVHDDDELFALLVLESFSVGLSWTLILHREALFRSACDGLRPALCAAYGPDKEEALMALPGMIHHRGKIRSIGENARAFLAVQKEHGSFDHFLWQHVNGQPVDHRPETLADVPARIALSEQLSRELKHYGFRYMGPVITYSYMQAAGLVNDHLLSCAFR